MYFGFLLVITFAIIFYKIKWRRHVKYLNKIPGPPVHFIPILGHLHLGYGPLDYVWKKLRELGKEYSIYRAWGFEEPMVMIRHPDDAEILLSNTTNLTKGAFYENLQPWLDHGLLTSAGPKWRNRRKILSPAFNFNVLKQYIKVFESQNRRLVTFIKNSEVKVMDTIPLFTRFALNTICETAMGIPLEEDGEEHEKYRKAVTELASMSFERMQNPLSQIKWLFELLPSGRRQAANLKVVHDFSANIIAKRKKYHETNKSDFKIFNETSKCESDDDDGRKKETTFLDLLLKLWKDGGIDDAGVQEEVDTFIFAGHDTATGTLAFLTLLFAEHQEIQERVRQEVNEVLQSGGSLGMSELNSLAYLERCIKEALRLYPIAPHLGRRLTTDMRLSGYLVPKGTTVNLSIYDLHRDPNFWPNPLVYDPDRFLPDKIRGRHPYSYLPFSAGPRNCIGQKFAMLEVKTAAALLLQNFHLELVDKAEDTRIAVDITMRTTGPMRVKFVPLTPSE